MYEMQPLEVNGAVLPIYGSLGVKGLNGVKREMLMSDLLQREV